MLIDWFTVGAQIINFVVLLWLMKRFLYAPILAAIGGREKRIADQMAAASQQEAAAAIIRLDLLAKNHVFDQDRASLLARAVDDSAHEHDRLVAAAHVDADALRAQQRSLLERERLAQHDQLARLVADQVFAITRRALSDLAGVDLEERMMAVLLVRLRKMPEAGRQGWVASSRTAPSGGLVRSRFEISASSRVSIQEAVDETCARAVPLTFETGAEAVCGIEVVVRDHKIAWTIGDYLRSLQDSIAAAPPPLAAAS